MTAREFLRFPPGQGNVLVPVGPPAAAALGTTLYTASRPVPLTAQRVLWFAARAGAARLVPGSRERWSPPMPEDVAAELHGQWGDVLGARVTGFAAYERPQQHRAGLALLVCAGRRAVLVRVRVDPAELALERRVSEQAEALGPLAFRVPRLRGVGEAGGWSWAAYEVIGSRPHSPARTIPDALPEQVAMLVERVLPRPADVPTHWRGAHGDLTPWNLRRAGGSRWLIDWEDCRYLPVGADEVYFAVTRAALRRPGRRPIAAPAAATEESCRYWLDDLARRTRDGKDVGLIDRMVSLLELWSGAA